MPTAIYTNQAFIGLNVYQSCIKLDLSTGDNKFDLSECNFESKEIKKIEEVLSKIKFYIPEIDILGGRVRLSHLSKDRANFSWSSEYSGSILLTIFFESKGTEIVGAFHGQINNGRLLIYLPIKINTYGQLDVKPLTRFDANINIEGILDEAERPVRRNIRRNIEEKAKNALEPIANDLAELFVTNLYERDAQGKNIPIPPEDALYTQFNIQEGQASVSWEESIRVPKFSFYIEQEAKRVSNPTITPTLCGSREINEEDHHNKYTEEKTYTPPIGWEIYTERQGGYTKKSQKGEGINFADAIEVTRNYITFRGEVSTLLQRKCVGSTIKIYKYNGILDVEFVIFIHKVS